MDWLQLKVMKLVLGCDRLSDWQCDTPVVAADSTNVVNITWLQTVHLCFLVFVRLS